MIEKARNFVIVLFFCGAIAAPGLVMVLGPQEADTNAERRTLASLPEVPGNWSELQEFPEAFDAFYSDRFGLRRELVEYRSLAYLRFLKSSPSEHVLMGKEGMMFRAAPSYVLNYQSFTEFSKKRLEQWAGVFEERRRFLEERGIRYLVVIAPLKNSIYPERMPDWVARSEGPGRFDGFMEYMRANTAVDVIDLRQALLSKKSEYKLYFDMDIHWNFLSGLIATQEILKVLKPDLSAVAIPSLEDFRIPERTWDRGALSRMLGIRKGVLLEIAPKPASRDRSLREKKTKGDGMEYSVSGKGASDYRPIVWNHTNEDLPRLVMFRDSFGHYIIPYISTHFSHSYFVWPPAHLRQWGSRFPDKFMEMARPDVVIDEMLEARLNNPPDDFRDYVSVIVWIVEPAVDVEGRALIAANRELVVRVDIASITDPEIGITVNGDRQEVRVVDDPKLGAKYPSHKFCKNVEFVVPLDRLLDTNAVEITVNEEIRKRFSVVVDKEVL